METPPTSVFFEPIQVPTTTSPSPTATESVFPDVPFGQSLESFALIPSGPSMEFSIPVDGLSDLAAPIPVVFADSDALPSVPVISTDSTDNAPSLRKSSRVSRPPSYLHDYKCNSISSTELTHSNLHNKSGSSTFKPGTNYPPSNCLDTSK